MVSLVFSFEFKNIMFSCSEYDLTLSVAPDPIENGAKPSYGEFWTHFAIALK